jgi:glycerophosphoryl diester phosphodiesterase
MPNPAPIAFAHRGARAERRENTLEAFERALELGATGLESDAWITADGVVVLDHDGVTGPLWRRRALSAQRRAELPGHMPSLAELYARCGRAYELSLDVKDPSALAAIVAAAEAAGATERLWLCFHDWRPMAAWRSQVGAARLVESTRLRWMGEGLGPRAAALAEAGIHAVNLHRSEWDTAGVAEVHRAGLKAFAWDAQASDDIAHLVDLGVDGIYSDHVDRMMAVIASGRGAA